KQDKRIWSVYKSGEDIRRGYERAESQREGETNYAAPAGKKINGVAYRLLNTVKAGNKEDFMDSLFRLHMSVGRPVNSVFLDALHEKKLDFASVGTAFIAGLLSSDRKKGRENDQ
ncbi:MAG TPA: type I-B CRISPR-associated protein Cas8b1/Cst1, partial [Clostridia bacterium]|nr:type I-B CRISPR-associated protein Cas8b1/Cst1 [Clostridia bacterium]